MQDCYCVLTGDLVRSSALTGTEMETARGALLAAANDLAQAPWPTQPFVVGALDFFRGDSWQLLLADARWGLRAAVYLRASLLVAGLCDTRVALGIGAIGDIDESRVSLSTGEAFELSGHALDTIGARFRMTLRASEICGLPADWPTLAVHLCDSVIGQWQGRQIESARLLAFNPGASHERIGRLLSPPVTQQAVSKSLHSAGWHGVAQAMEQFERNALKNNQ